MITASGQAGYLAACSFKNQVEKYTAKVFGPANYTEDHARALLVLPTTQVRQDIHLEMHTSPISSHERLHLSYTINVFSTSDEHFTS